jgi:hypothetical protein
MWFYGHIDRALKKPTMKHESVPLSKFSAWYLDMLGSIDILTWLLPLAKKSSSS